MMITAASHSIFSPLVAGSGSIIAMSTALLLGWKGREKWEPSDQDIDKGAQKVGALAAGILIAFMFIELSKPDAVPILMRISLQSLVVTVASLLVYGSLTTIFVYVQWQGTPQQRNIVGGIVLKSEARNALAREKRLAMERGETPPTVQELFMGAAYVIDQLWSGPSRAITKGLFILGYLGLTVAGTTAIASASIAIGQQIHR